MDNLICCLADAKGKHVVFVTKDGADKHRPSRLDTKNRPSERICNRGNCEADVQITDLKGII